jgi:hypothetical protein
MMMVPFIIIIIIDICIDKNKINIKINMMEISDDSDSNSSIEEKKNKPNKRKVNNNNKRKKKKQKDDNSDSDDDDNEYGHDNDNEDKNIVTSQIPVDFSLATCFETRLNTFRSPFIYLRSLKKAVFAHNPIPNKLRGLHDTMKAAFYDNYSNFKVSRNVEKLKTQRSSDGIQTEDQYYKDMKKGISMYSSNSKGAPRGLMGGSLIDNHCNAAINQKPIEADTKHDNYPASKKEKKVFMNKPWNIEEKQVDLICPHARKVLMHLVNLGFTPIRAQLIVWHEGLNIITKAEQLWLDLNTGELILFELKLAADEKYKLGNKKMHYPYNEQVNSSKNQHQLHLLFQKKMVEFTFAVTINKAAVVRINHDKQVQLYYLESWTETNWNKAVIRVREIMGNIDSEDENMLD